MILTPPPFKGFMRSDVTVLVQNVFSLDNYMPGSPQTPTEML